MKKFFQVKDNVSVENPHTNNIEDNIIIEADLDKQESFFAKILKNTLKEPAPEIYKLNKPKVQEDNTKPTTPVCDIIKCGDNSNDTNYSGSTINDEINKSIALFEDEPQDIARVSNIRQLLNSKQDSESTVDGNNVSILSNPIEIAKHKTIKDKTDEVDNITKIDCPECGKVIAINMLAEHSDYHLALKFREEERQTFRDEKEKLNRTLKERRLNNVYGKDKVKDKSKNEIMSSIEKFITKVGDCDPTETCVECGRKILSNKFSEHLDFHEAQKLKRELNQKPALIITNANRSTSSVKRKKILQSSTNKTKLQCRSIDSFFR